MRFTAKVLVAGCLVALLACWVFEVAESFGASLFPEIRAHGDTVARERKQRDDFTFHVNWIAREVVENRLSLREASRLVEAAAAERWPVFLTYAEMIGAPGSLRTKLAFNLLRQFQNDLSPCHAERLAELTREYQALAAEERGGS